MSREPKQELEVASSRISNQIMFEYKALTETEQYIFIELAYSKSALNTLEIYFGVAGRILHVARQRYWTSGHPTPTPTPKEALPPVFRKFTPDNMSYDSRILSSGHIARRDAEALIQKYRDAGMKIPVYTTIQRMLEDLTALGWVLKRESAAGRATGLFFLTDEMREKIKNEL